MYWFQFRNLLPLLNVMSLCRTKHQNVLYGFSTELEVILIVQNIQKRGSLRTSCTHTGGGSACWCYRKEQTFCGLKGLLLDDMPVSRGSCWAFWRQNCCKSAAAWDTCGWEIVEASYCCATTTTIAIQMKRDSFNRRQRNSTRPTIVT